MILFDGIPQMFLESISTVLFAVSAVEEAGKTLVWVYYGPCQVET
jgi:hypothetical protein